MLLLLAIHESHGFSRSTSAAPYSSRPRIFFPIQLHASSNNNESENKPKVRFSGLGDSQSATVSNPADFAISWIASDVGSIVLGLAGIILLLVGRLALDADEVTQDAGQVTRSNLLAVFAAGSVLLNGLSKLDVESAMSQAVTLVGETLPAPVFFTSTPNDSEWRWVRESLQSATPTETAVVLEKEGDGSSWEVAAAVGIVPSTQGGTLPQETPIVDRCLRDNQSAEAYLPTLQALPGRTEFTYLPTNTQAVLVLPVVTEPNRKVALVLGSDQAKSYTPRDIAWCQVVAGRLSEVYNI